MATPSTMFDTVIEQYVRNFGEKHTEEEIEQLIVAVRTQIINEMLSEVEDDQIADLKQRAEKEADSYKRNLFHKIRISLVVETIFIAFLVGLIVNHVTNLLPQSVCWSGWIIIVSLLLCVLCVVLATSEPNN